MTALAILATLASAIPTLNIERLCRGETSVGQQAVEYESCVRGERAALKTLQEKWASYPASVRDPCARVVKVAPNADYVELMTCIEIRTNVGGSK